MNILAPLLAIIPFLLVIGIPIMIGVYVYKDANYRGMNAALWTLIAILAPAFTGFIVYLIVRSSYSNLNCPACDAHVSEQYTACPKCGAKLKAVCPGCSFPIEPDWTVCPKCTTPLSGQQYGFTPPAQKKDTSLGKILIAVILIPLLLFALVIVLSLSSFSISSSLNTMYLTEDHYENQPQITEWIEACNEDPSKTYALSYKSGRNKIMTTTYLIYRPANDAYTNVETKSKSGWFGAKIQVDFTEGAELYPYENRLISVTSKSNKHADLKVSLNNKTIDCDIKEVDYNLALVEFTEEYD